MKRSILTLLIVFTFGFISSISSASNAKVETLSLNKGWRFYKGDIPFPVITGQGMTYESAKAGKSWGAASPGFDDTDWRIVTLPHDWAVESPFDSLANMAQGYRERGIGWYRRSFKLDESDNGKYIELQFDGIATHATIWVNGTVLHRNFCGYTSMYIDITPYAYYGNTINNIAIRVDADVQEGWWYEGAGLYRNTWLVKRNPVHIITDGVYANPVKVSEGWEIPVEVTLNNTKKYAENVTVDVSLFDPKGQLVTSASTVATIPVLKNAVANMLLKVINPTRWDINNPVLYTVKTTLSQNKVVLQEEITKCGFRTIRFDNETGFYLNDKPLKIKGVCDHQDHAGVGTAIPDGVWQFRFSRLKEMGVNAYRVAHNPSSKELLNIADSIGIMVFAENRNFNASPEYIRQLEWLIRRDRNRPSIILWSVFNEEPMQATPRGYEMARRMVSVVKSLDTTRPVTAAMNGGFFSTLNVGHAVDLVGTNYQIRDYDRFHKENPSIPFMSSEDGSAFMTRGVYKTDLTKNEMSSYDTESARWGATHRNSWKLIDTRPFMAGGFYWTGFDYRGEPTPLKWPTANSFFGISDLCGFPKAAYYIRQAQWLENKNVLEMIPHWNWPADTIGKPIQVMVMSNGDSLVLKLNGKVIGGQKADKYEMNSWNVPYKPGKLEVFSYKNNKLVARKEVSTTTNPVQVKLTPFKAKLVGNGTDATPITVELVDAKGRHVPTAQNRVKFEIAGPGRIIGVGNGNPNSHELDKANERSLFNGLAQVIVQTDELQGNIELTATVNGMKPAKISIPVVAGDIMPFVAVERPTIMLDRWRVSARSTTKPDPNAKLAENDNNTWEPFGGGNLKAFNEQSYYVLRTTFIPYQSFKTNGGVISFKNVSGAAEFWLNGKLLAKKESYEMSDFDLKFPAVGNACELRVLLIGNKHIEPGMSNTVLVN